MLRSVASEPARSTIRTRSRTCSFSSSHIVVDIPTETENRSVNSSYDSVHTVVSNSSNPLKDRTVLETVPPHIFPEVLITEKREVNFNLIENCEEIPGNLD